MKPRLAAVLMKLDNVLILLISAHLPHQQRPPAERQEVVELLDATLTANAGADIVLIGIDANARLPTDVPGCTGDLVFGQPDDFGESLIPLLLRHGLSVPSLYSDVHEGPSHTWKHAKGSLSRIDFVICPCQISSYNLPAAVLGLLHP